MRPNSRTQQNLVRTVKAWGGLTIYIYAIMAGLFLLGHSKTFPLRSID